MQDSRSVCKRYRVSDFLLFNGLGMKKNLEITIMGYRVWGLGF